MPQVIAPVDDAQMLMPELYVWPVGQAHEGRDPVEPDGHVVGPEPGPAPGVDAQLPD